MADPGEQEWTGVIIISSMVLFSAILRFGRNGEQVRLRIFNENGKNTCLAKRCGRA